MIQIGKRYLYVDASCCGAFADYEHNNQEGTVLSSEWYRDGGWYNYLIEFSDGKVGKVSETDLEYLRSEHYDVALKHRPLGEYW